VSEEGEWFSGVGVAYPGDEVAVAGERAVQLNHDPAERHEGGERAREHQRAPAVLEQPAVEGL